MKKVLALVLTLAMLVGSLAVGLSAAFEFTATEDGDKFENVYSIPLESTAGRVTYFNVKGATDANRNLRFDLWFEKADGGVGVNFDSNNNPVVKTDRIGVKVGGEEKTIPFQFNLMQKYDIQLRTGGAPAGKTNVIIDGETIGVIDGQIAKGDIYCGAAGVLMDNIVLTDGNDTQATINFDGTYRNGDNYEDCDHVSALEYRIDLGKKYGQFSSGMAFLNFDSNWRESSDKYSIEFDFKLGAPDALFDNGSGSHMTPRIDMKAGKVGVGGNNGLLVDYTFEMNEWYHILYSVEGDRTRIYLNGQELEGNFPKMYGAPIDGEKSFYSWLNSVGIDNLRVGKYMIDFEDGYNPDVFLNESYTQRPVVSEYVGEQVNIFDKISTYPVEGEATLIKPRYNDEKNPNIPANSSNYKDLAAEYPSGTIKGEYLVDFDLAIYPDKEGTISSDKTQNGAWIELITNAFGDGDNSRVKIGNNFAGKGKDLVYYGEDDVVKGMQPWAAGEFHNIAIMVANGSATIYIDKEEVYSAPVGMKYWDTFLYWYTQNCGVIIDNYRVYDVKTFEAKITSFNSSSDLVVTIPDVNAENFCEANGQHIRSWARKADPKCYETGVNTYKCWICGATEDKAEVAKLEHKFEHYDINRTEKVNDEDLIVTHCRTSAGCPETRYAKLPAAEEYQGELKFYHDFQDDFAKVTADSWGFETIEDGVAKYIGSDHNYNQIGLGREYSSTELNGGIKVGFDFSVDGTFDTEASTGRYGHSFDFYIGGGTVGAATVKYNMDDQKFSIAATNNNFVTRTTEDAYPLVPGEVYNIEVAFAINEDDMLGELSLYLNGEKILWMDEEQAYDYLTYTSSINCILMHVYGVKISVDNLVIGDYDFGWNRAYAGDVDGDYAITVNDALLMRKYLAKIIDMDALYQSRADVNGDGYVDAIDQLRIRKALAE